MGDFLGGDELDPLSLEGGFDLVVFAVPAASAAAVAAAVDKLELSVRLVFAGRSFCSGGAERDLALAPLI